MFGMLKIYKQTVIGLVFTNFTSPKSRIALQVARKIAQCDRAFRVRMCLIYVGQPLCINIVLYDHMFIVFLPILTKAILELPSCSCCRWLTFLERWHWLVKRE